MSDQPPQDQDRLQWIFNAGRDGADLSETYDRWADGYDDDHAAWGWAGPEAVASAYTRLASGAASGPVLDAGCGTGAAGAALRSLAVEAELLGLDLSGGMLRRAGESGHYDRLLLASLDRLPMAHGSVGGVVSCGVFTHGHVGPEALSELVRVTAPGGVIAITQRLDIADRYRAEADRLEAAGYWRLLEVTDPKPFHPCRDEGDEEPSLQSVLTWRVEGRGDSGS